MIMAKAEESRVLERDKQRKNDDLQIRRFKRGDIVWARVFHRTWWPGLVLRRDNKLGFFVSFLNFEKSRYFVESEICSFNDNFKLHFRNVECSVLLDRALILLGQKAALSLMCRCQISMKTDELKRRNLMDVGLNSVEEVDVEARNLFQPVVVLGFVVSMAVCPWVEDVDIVHVVREAAQIMTFRRFVSVQQGLICREAKPHENLPTLDGPEAIMTSIYSKPQSYSSFGGEIYSVTRESDSLEVEDKCHIFSELVERNVVVPVTNIKKSRSFVSNETFEYLQEVQHDIIRELSTPMEEDLMSVEGEQVVLNLNIEKQDQGYVIHRERKMDCSPVNLNFLFSEKLNSIPADLDIYKTNTVFLRRQSRELQYSDAFPLKPQIRPRTQKGSAKQSKAKFLHEMLVNLHCLALDPFYLGGENLKLMEQNLLNFRILLFRNITDLPSKKCSPCKTIVAQLSHCGYDYHFKTQLSDKVDGKSGGGATFGALIPYMQSPVNRLKRRLDQPAVSNHLKLSKTMPFFSITGPYLQRNRTIFDEDLSDVFFSGSLVKLKILNHPSTGSQNLTFTCTNSLTYLDVVQNNNSPVEDTSRCCEIVEMSMVQEPEENAIILNDNRTCISYDYDAIDKIIDGVQTEDVQVDSRSSLPQPASVESVIKNAIGTHADKITNARAATRKSRLLSHLRVDPTEMEPSNNYYGATTNMIDRKASMKFTCEDSFKDNREFYQPITTDLLSKSQAAPQSRTESSFAVPSSLHMKFPKDFDLPSKDELVKKFTQFGSVDSLKSKIFSYTGSALVVFLNELDAVAAYHYAKRKKVLFGQANVRFWLDPFEHSRKGIPLTKPPMWKLKSCLKKSMPLGKEDCKKSRRVRFLLRTP